MEGKQVSGGWYGQGGGLTHLVVNLMIKIQKWWRWSSSSRLSRCEVQGTWSQSQNQRLLEASSKRSSIIQPGVAPNHLFDCCLFAELTKVTLVAYMEITHATGRSNLPTEKYDWMIEYWVVSWIFVKIWNLYTNRLWLWVSKNQFSMLKWVKKIHTPLPLTVSQTINLNFFGWLP